MTSSSPTQLDCVEGLGQGTDLVDLNQQGVGSLLLNALLQTSSGAPITVQAKSMYGAASPQI